MKGMVLNRVIHMCVNTVYVCIYERMNACVYVYICMNEWKAPINLSRAYQARYALTDGLAAGSSARVGGS
jgi:hypothetical protein